MPLLVLPSPSHPRAAVLVHCGKLLLDVETVDEPGALESYERLSAQLSGTQVLITSTGAPLTSSYRPAEGVHFLE